MAVAVDETVHIRARKDIAERYRRVNGAMKAKGRSGTIRDLTDAALLAALPALEKAEAAADKKANR